MFCHLCGNILDSITSNCKYCFNKIFNTCLQCGCMNLYDPKYRYCVDCRANLKDRNIKKDYL